MLSCRAGSSCPQCLTELVSEPDVKVITVISINGKVYYTVHSALFLYAILVVR